MRNCRRQSMAMSDIDKFYWQGYDKGFEDALYQLQEVYGDVKETGVWKDFYADKTETE